MDWINKNQGILTLLIMLALGGWNLYLSIKTETREESTITKNANDLIAKLEERVSRAQTDLEKANTITAELEKKVFEIDKHLAVMEERLKLTTTKTLMAAGITKEQALEYWNNPSSYITLIPKSQNEMKTQKLNIQN